MKYSLLIILLAPMTLACAGYESPGEKLRDGVMRYNDAIRWEKSVGAPKYSPDAKQAAYRRDHRDAHDGLKVLEYELHNVQHMPPNRADVTVRYKWLRPPSNVVETTFIKQNWKYGEDKTWRIVDKTKVERPKAKAVSLEDRL